VVQPLDQVDGCRLISLEPYHPTATLCVAVTGLRGAGRELSVQDRYAIIGGTAAERALAAFLLAEQGIDARPLA
jgi:hypothetical protein